MLSASHHYPLGPHLRPGSLHLGTHLHLGDHPGMTTADLPRALIEPLAQAIPTP
jgi:hypothetical protein